MPFSLFSILILTIPLTSCSPDYEQPNKVEPRSPQNKERLLKIEELKETLAELEREWERSNQKTSRRSSRSQDSNCAGIKCLCPNDRDSAGRRCGARSAYSRSGGCSPSC